MPPAVSSLPTRFCPPRTDLYSAGCRNRVATSLPARAAGPPQVAATKRQGRQHQRDGAHVPGEPGSLLRTHTALAPLIGVPLYCAWHHGVPIYYPTIDKGESSCGRANPYSRVYRPKDVRKSIPTYEEDLPSSSVVSRCDYLPTAQPS